MLPGMVPAHMLKSRQTAKLGRYTQDQCMSGVSTLTWGNVMDLSGQRRGGMARSSVGTSQHTGRISPCSAPPRRHNQRGSVRHTRSPVTHRGDWTPQALHSCQGTHEKVCQIVQQRTEQPDSSNCHGQHLAASILQLGQTKHRSQYDGI